MSSKLKIQFPGLNELRALAALSVIPGHVEQIKGIFKLQFAYWFPIPGKVGVVLFFALSGFLITTLLLGEKKSHGIIDLRQFYKRRLLRIFPLYILIVTLSVLVFNRIPFLQMPIYSAQFYENMDLGAALLLLLVLPNYLQLIIPYAAHMWSIGIEEQFYLVQPILIKIVKNACVLSVAMIFVVFLPEVLSFINLHYQVQVNSILYNASVYFGCIAIGSLGALICSGSSNILKGFVYHRLTQIASLVAVLYFVALVNISGDERVIDFRFYAVCFLIFVANSATNDRSFLRVNSHVLDRIGKISYGIYVYHPVCIGLSIALALQFSVFVENDLALNIAVYVLTFVLTFSVSSLSYKWFESYFLSLDSSSRM
jgi:peptidoglycan/LPS O-acetylase OafA/YrhL